MGSGLTVDPGCAAGTHPCSWSSGIAGWARMPTGSPGAWPIRSGSCARTSASACCRGAPGAGVAGTPRRSAGRRRRRRGDRDPEGRSPEARWTSWRPKPAAFRAGAWTVSVSIVSSLLLSAVARSQQRQPARCHVRSAETESESPPTAALQSSRRRAWTYRQPEHPKMIAAAATIAASSASSAASVSASAATTAAAASNKRARVVC